MTESPRPIDDSAPWRMEAQLKGLRPTPFVADAEEIVRAAELEPAPSLRQPPWPVVALAWGCGVAMGVALTLSVLSAWNSRTTPGVAVNGESVLPRDTGLPRETSESPTPRETPQRTSNEHQLASRVAQMERIARGGNELRAGAFHWTSTWADSAPSESIVLQASGSESPGADPLQESDRRKLPLSVKSDELLEELLGSSDHRS